MRTSLITTIVLMATLAGAVPGTKAASIFESDAELTPGSEIDKLVLDRLQQLGIQPARVCSDEVFVRRVYLDVIGTLPTSDEAREFLQDSDLIQTALQFVVVARVSDYHRGLSRES